MHLAPPPRSETDKIKKNSITMNRRR